MYFFIILSINDLNFIFILKFSNSRYFLKSGACFFYWRWCQSFITILWFKQ